MIRATIKMTTEASLMLHDPEDDTIHVDYRPGCVPNAVGIYADLAYVLAMRWRSSQPACDTIDALPALVKSFQRHLMLIHTPVVEVV